MRMTDLERTRYDWIEGEDGIADPAKPTLAELQAGTNISKAVVNSTQIMAAASDTTNERDVTANANSQTATIGNYTGDLRLFRDGDEMTGLFDEDEVFSLFDRRGRAGWMVKRTGLRWDAAYAASQKHLEVFLFVTDNPIRSGGAQDGYLKAQVPLLPQGKFSVNAVVAAAAGGGS